MKERYKIRLIRKNKNSNVPTNLQVILKQKKITQCDLAKMADLELSQVSIIVTGIQKDLLMSTAKKICNALDVSLDDAFGDDFTKLIKD